MAEPVSHRNAISRYFVAVWKDGIAAMGATLGILLAFGAAYYAFVAQHNIAALWLLALLSFLFAGYRIWLHEYRKNIESNGKPKLTGFFQGFEIYSYGDDTEELTEDGKAIVVVPGFHRPLGVEVILKYRMVNENPTPTTLYNFNLRMTYFGQEGFAEHADEWVFEGISEKERTILWEQNERRFADNEDAEKRCPNLVNYLRTHEMAQGKGLEGGLVFRFPGMKFMEGSAGDKPNIILKLGIEDAWGFVHYIERWGRKGPPLPRRVKSPRFW